MKKYFNLFLYISIVFLLIVLYKFDYLKIPQIGNANNLIISFLCLLLGYFFDIYAWYKILKINKYKLSIFHSISSMGMSIFGKYIPGKFWLVIGRSAYIAKKTGSNEKDLAVLSVRAQFMSLLAGLFVGGLVFIYIPFSNSFPFLILTILMIAALILILFSNRIHKLTSNLVVKVFRKELIIPKFKFNESITIIVWYLLVWISWSIGFFFFIKTFSSADISFLSGFTFALAAIIGLLAIFFPGGLGVRETLIVTLLHFLSLSIAEATSISVAARLWFIIGESALFVSGLIMHKMKS